MTVIVVPYHQDERLADDLIPLPERGDYLVLEPDLPGVDLWFRLGALDDAIAAQVALAVAEGGRTTVLSGDCLVALGTLAGAQRAGLEPALIWLDAHGDVHTLETSTSGYLGGVSLRVLTGAHTDRYADRIGLRPLPPERAVLVDARDLDPAEAEYLAISATRRIAVSEVDSGTVPPGPLVLHVDLDVVDSAELTGLRFPASGGPSADAVLAACERLLATGLVVAFDIACPWWPASSDEERTVRASLVSRLQALSDAREDA